VHSNKNLWDGITILYNSFAITVSDCHLYQNGRAGIVADGVYADVKVSVVNIIGNTVVGSLGLEPVSGGIVLEWSREILVSNNQVYDCVENCYDSGYGIEAASVSFSEISSNVVYHNDAIGIYLQCDAQNNLIKDNKVTGSGDSGIVVFNAVGAGNNAIIGNQIYDSLAHGILVYQSNRTFVSGNSLANNGAGASGSSGIYLSASSNCTVSFNKVYDSDDYELKIGSGSNYNMVVGNDLRQTAPGTHTGSFLNSGTGTKAHDNLGDSGWLAET
jgi:parallel beta-helix repeat protein